MIFNGNFWEKKLLPTCRRWNILFLLFYSTHSEFSPSRCVMPGRKTSQQFEPGRLMWSGPYAGTILSLQSIFFILPVDVFSNTAILARFTKILITFILTIFLPSLKNSLANIYAPLTRCLLLLAHWQPVTIIRFSILAIYASLRGAPLFRYNFCFHVYGKFDKTVLFATLLLRESRLTSTKVVIKQLFNDKWKFISFKPRISTRE